MVYSYVHCPKEVTTMLCPLHPHWVMSSYGRKVDEFHLFCFSQSPAESSGLHQFSLLQTIRKNMFPLGKCSIKRAFLKSCKLLLQTGEKLLPLKNLCLPKKHHFLSLSCLSALLHLRHNLWLARATLATGWTTHTSSTMSKSLPSKPSAQFYSPPEPCKQCSAEPDLRTTDTAELTAWVWRVFPAMAIMRIYPCSADLTFAGFTLSDKERADFVTRRQQQPFSIFSAQGFKIPPGKQKSKGKIIAWKGSIFIKLFPVTSFIIFFFFYHYTLKLRVIFISK